ncbi:hypothetical protein FB451DRAFT_1260795 [Mycena latifolia]|nr:hypothetical protein FB451DRAFT_1260795 [Mycena latifolia]
MSGGRSGGRGRSAPRASFFARLSSHLPFTAGSTPESSSSEFAAFCLLTRLQRSSRPSFATLHYSSPPRSFIRPTRLSNSVYSSTFCAYSYSHAYLSIPSALCLCSLPSVRPDYLLNISQFALVYQVLGRRWILCSARIRPVRRIRASDGVRIRSTPHVHVPALKPQSLCTEIALPT